PGFPQRRGSPAMDARENEARIAPSLCRSGRENRKGMLRQRKRTRLTVFGASEARHAAHEVEINPAKREQFSETGAGRECQDDERIEKRIAAPLAGRKESRSFFLREEPHSSVRFGGTPYLPDRIVVEPAPFPDGDCEGVREGCEIADLGCRAC